jgi:O-antigen biosynthesis protein
VRQDAVHLAEEWALSEPILFVQSPGWWPAVLPLREALGAGLVYDCLDEHTGWDSAVAESVRAAEEGLASASDLVLASAERLYRRLSTLAWNIILVRNRCDFESFRTAEAPNGLWKAQQPGPLIGFYGALGHAWFDVQLMLSVAAMRPDWSFVLIGPSYGDVAEAFEGADNVHLTGEVAWADLPALSADFDVATIPWLLNALTEATDPVKLWEYFAAGKPRGGHGPTRVVPLPGLARHRR